MFGILNWVSSAVSAVGHFANSTATAIGGAANSVVGTTTRIALAAVETVAKMVSSSVEVAKAAFSSSVEIVGAAASGIGTAVMTVVANPLNLGGAASALVSGTSNALLATGKGIATTGLTALQGGVQSANSIMTFLQTSVDSFVTLAVALLSIPFGYNQWQMVELPVSSGASCGNGSPYRFFVNKTPLNNNAIIYLEGGGGCWDYKSCTNQRADVFVTNKNGEVPRNYMTLPGLIQSILTASGSMPEESLPNQGVGGLESPFLARMHPAGKVQTQAWNIVFAPYCTADVHVGNIVKLYANPDDESKLKVYFHKGHKNAQLVTAWMKANLPRPDKLLVVGSSAGGYGATANYGTFRDALSPKKSSALLNDSGVFFWAPQVLPGEVESTASLPAYNKVITTWHLDAPGQLVSEYRAKYPSIDTTNLGSIVLGWAQHYPKDRIGVASFSADMVIPNFMYSELPSFATASNKTELAETLFRKEIDNTFFNHFPERNNLGFYIPNWRSLMKSHTLTTGSFGNTGIPELEIQSVTLFVDNLLNDSAIPVMRAYEKNKIKTSQTSTMDDYMEFVLGKATDGIVGSILGY